MRRALPFLMLAIGLVGCTGETDAGDAAPGKTAVAPMKTPDQLPDNMPPEAKAAAESAMAQAKAREQEANDPGRVRAMNEMKKQRGG